MCGARLVWNSQRGVPDDAQRDPTAAVPGDAAWSVGNDNGSTSRRNGADSDRSGRDKISKMGMRTLATAPARLAANVYGNSEHPVAVYERESRSNVGITWARSFDYWLLWRMATYKSAGNSAEVIPP